jgi:hypothetical protein
MHALQTDTDGPLAAPAAWAVDVALRQRAAEYVRRSAQALKSLATLLSNIPNIVIEVCGLWPLGASNVLHGHCGAWFVAHLTCYIAIAVRGLWRI